MTKKLTDPAKFFPVLRRAIKSSGHTHYALNKQTGVPISRIDDFMAGKDIRLSTASKLAAVLGVEMRPANSGEQPE